MLSITNDFKLKRSKQDKVEAIEKIFHTNSNQIKSYCINSRQNRHESKNITKDKNLWFIRMKGQFTQR